LKEKGEGRKERRKEEGRERGRRDKEETRLSALHSSKSKSQNQRKVRAWRARATFKESACSGLPWMDGMDGISFAPYDRAINLD
jgi:hypothetical protein